MQKWACKGEQFIITECSILPSQADSDLDLAVQPWMPLNSDLAERAESFPSDSYPELLLFTQASRVETSGWRACGNNSLQVLAAIWKLWCRKKNRVTSLSSKWAFLLPRASVVLTLFNTSSLTQNERLVHAVFQAHRSSLPEWSRYICLISTFFSTIIVKGGKWGEKGWSGGFFASGLPNFHGSLDIFAML